MEYSYDQYISDCINFYESTFCYGEPKIIDVEKEYEGNGEYSDSYIYNCHECDNKDCKYWKELN